MPIKKNLKCPRCLRTVEIEGGGASCQCGFYKSDIWLEGYWAGTNREGLYSKADVIDFVAWSRTKEAREGFRSIDDEFNYWNENIRPKIK